METNFYNFDFGLNKKIRAVMVSDLHGEGFAKLLTKINELSPDVILCPGDILHKADVDDNGLEFLRETSKAYPVFMALGNHEVKHGGDLKAEITKTGVTLLDGRFVEFEGLLIGGLGTGYEPNANQSRWKMPPRPDIEALDEFFKSKKPKILLSHHPEYFEKYLSEKNCNLILSGHAHGGQWRIFGRGIFAPGQGIFPKYTSGLYHSRLLVGRGLSNKTHVPRIFNKKELIVIDLE